MILRRERSGLQARSLGRAIYEDVSLLSDLQGNFIEVYRTRFMESLLKPLIVLNISTAKIFIFSVRHYATRHRIWLTAAGSVAPCTESQSSHFAPKINPQ